MRNYKRLTNRGKTPLLTMKTAANLVLQEKLNIPTAAQKFNICRQSLYRFIKKFGTNIDAANKCCFYSGHNKVFSEAQEKALAESINKISREKNKHIKGAWIRSIAYKFALSENVKFPNNWEKKQEAGLDWMQSFIKRNKCHLETHVKNTKVFTIEEELKFINYIKKYQHAVLPQDVRKWAYKFAAESEINIPETWEKYKIAPVDWWMTLFQKHKKHFSNIVILQTEKSLNESDNSDKFYCLYVCEDSCEKEVLSVINCLDSNIIFDGNEMGYDNCDSVVDLLKCCAYLSDGEGDSNNSTCVFVYLPKAHLVVYLQSILHEYKEEIG